jgi:hypothetical protein
VSSLLDDAPASSSSKSKRGGNRPGSGRPKTSARRAELEASLRGPLGQVAEWLEARDPELAVILHDDAPKMARLLAGLALNAKTPAPIVFAVRGLASLLEPLDAFGRTLRHLAKRWRERRARLVAEREEQELADAGVVIVPDVDGQPAGDSEATPSRFRYDTEPPETD